MFWILAIIIAVIAALLIAIPLFRAEEDDSAVGSNDAEVYRDQLREVDRDETTGLVKGEEAAQARTEIARRLIAASENAPRKTLALRTSHTVILAGLLCLFVPLVAGVFYSRAGVPDAPDFPLRARFESPDPDSNILIASVEMRLQNNPADGRGWEVLAPIYMKSGRLADAANAWRNAIKYLGPDARRFGALGEALVVGARGKVDKDAREAFAKVLELTPGDPRARFYLALADAQAGKFDEALAQFATLKKESPADAPWLGIINDQVTLINAAKEEQAKAPGNPTQADVEAAADMSDADRMQMIQTMVESLDARLADDPANFEGWQRLIRSYVMLQDPVKAADALKRGLAAFPAGSENGKALIALAKELGIDEEGATQ